MSKPGFLYVAVEPITGGFSVFLSNLTSNQTLFKSLPNNTKNQSLVAYVNQYYLQNLSYITWVQIRDGYTSQQIVNPIGSNRFMFNATTDVIPNITYTGLTNGTFYMISMFATAEDPSYFAQRSVIYQYIQNTTAIQGLTLAGERTSMLGIVVFILVLIGILF